MSRWEPGTADRLRGAAIELFLERGYDATTVDDVAARAGVTQRTFFRHFADKEEVLFDAGDAMEQILADAAAAALADLEPSARTGVAAARSATCALAASFEGDRPAHRDRAAVLSQAASLQARQLLKQERWMRRLRDVLVETGVRADDAAIAVEIAAASFRLAYAEWLASPRDRRLVTLLRSMDAAFDDVLRS